MKKSIGFKFAASTLVLGVTMVGCKPAGYRPSVNSAKAATTDAGAAKAYSQAQQAVQKGDLASALEFAEQAVEFAPRDAGYRMLLADLYLKNGRFIAADEAFADVLTLDPGNQRAGLSRVLAMIGQGKSGEATLELDRLSNSAAPADLGLAFALAGNPQRAVELLEPAARAPGASGRVRQNLALAYAMAGDWQKARRVAEQDLSPAEVAGRLEQWAAFANPTAPYSQVAALLGVNPVADSGRPVRLALVSEPVAYAAAEVPAPAVAAQPAPEPVRFAASEPAPAAAPQPTSVAAPQATPVVVAEAAPQPAAQAAPEPAPQTFAYQAPQPVETFSAPAAEPATVKVASASSKRSKRVAMEQVAAAVETLVKPREPVARATVRLASAPIRAFQVRKPASKPQPSLGGRYVVQLGAFRTAAQVEKAWAAAQRRYRFGNAEPLTTTVTIPGKGTFHRLAVSGFGNPTDANRMCQSIRSRSGVCFVRATAGDARVQWASRYTGRRA